MIFIKDSGNVIHAKRMSSFRIEAETCPTCGQRGNCHVFAYYKRHLVDFVDVKVVCVQIRILRVICGSCGHTHAILSDAIIPYESHSILFILRVLGEFSLRFKTVHKFYDARIVLGQIGLIDHVFSFYVQSFPLFGIASTARQE